MYTIPRITTIEQLKTYLHAGPGYDGYDVLLNSVDLEPGEYQKLAQWDALSYTRVILEKDEDIEISLLCWEPGQKSPIHNHAGSESWIKVLEGQLTETLYYENNADGGSLNLKDITVINPGELCYVQDHFGLHRIENTSMGRTISLHIYTPPVELYNIYNEETGELE